MRTDGSKSPPLLSRTPSPGQWLRGRLADLDRSQRSLAFDIGYDAAQVNKWISGKERMPDKALLLAGRSLGEGDFEVARNLLAINVLVEALPHDAYKATQSDEDTGFAVAKALASKAEDTAAQLSSDESDQPHEPSGPSLDSVRSASNDLTVHYWIYGSNS